MAGRQHVPKGPCEVAGLQRRMALRAVELSAMRKPHRLATASARWKASKSQKAIDVPACAPYAMSFLGLRRVHGRCGHTVQKHWAARVADGVC